MEPAAVLVAALEVDVGRPGQVRRACPRTAAWEEPESNQTSRMSVSLSKSVPPHFGQAKPSGRSSRASRAYQASAVSFSKTSATWRTSSGRRWTSSQPLQ